MADVIFVVVLLALALVAAEVVRLSCRRQLASPIYVERRVEAHAEAE